MKYDETFYSLWYIVSVNGSLTKDLSNWRQFSNCTLRVARTCQPQSPVNSWCSHACSQIMRSNKLHCKLTQRTQRGWWFSKGPYQMFWQRIIPDVSAKALTRCFSKGSYQMFWQRIIPDVLAKNHTRCFSEWSYQMFWQRIILDVLAKDHTTYKDHIRKYSLLHVLQAVILLRNFEQQCSCFPGQVPCHVHDEPAVQL